MLFVLNEYYSCCRKILSIFLTLSAWNQKEYMKTGETKILLGMSELQREMTNPFVEIASDIVFRKPFFDKSFKTILKLRIKNQNWKEKLQALTGTSVHERILSIPGPYNVYGI